MNSRRFWKLAARMLAAERRNALNAWSIVPSMLGFGRRSKRYTPIALLSAGTLIGGTAFLVSRSPARRDFVMMWGKKIGGVLGKGFGMIAGRAFGAHPVRTAQIAEGMRDLLSSKPG